MVILLKPQLAYQYLNIRKELYAIAISMTQGAQLYRNINFIFLYLRHKGRFPTLLSPQERVRHFASSPVFNRCMVPPFTLSPAFNHWFPDLRFHRFFVPPVSNHWSSICTFTFDIFL